MRFVERQTLFNNTTISGVLPDVAVQSDVLNSVGAIELRDLSDLTSSCLALKYQGHSPNRDDHRIDIDSFTQGLSMRMASSSGVNREY